MQQSSDTASGTVAISIDDVRVAARDACEKLRQISLQRPRLVILGESNAGKTTLTNQLVGGGLLPTSVICNTRFPTLIRYGDTLRVYAVDEAQRYRPIAAPEDLAGLNLQSIHIEIPSDILLEYEVLDTPSGFCLDPTRLEASGTTLIPIWCTVATQAWKSSELRAWQSIEPRTRLRGLLAVTCWDRVRDPVLRDRLLLRLQSEARSLFSGIGVTPALPSDAMSIVQIAGDVARRCRERRRISASRLSNRIVRLTHRVLGTADPSLVAMDMERGESKS